ncbi:MAG: tripartite tricarboxylate transporter permease, partial [Pseudoalteromonas tetraodonis]|nr:tripartite tricarboxylate transporter permease [Pseudoalteromonas tetraodonis]
MDLATIIGILGAIGLIVMSMFMSSSGEVAMFYNTPSVVIVFGGSLFIVLSNFTMSQFLGIGKVCAKAFMFKIEPPEALIEKAVELADSARKGGFLALEEAEIPNPFMRKGVDMLVDGHDADVVRATLQKDISLTTTRHEMGASLFKSLGDIAPAMGMIGTLIGAIPGVGEDIAAWVSYDFAKRGSKDPNQFGQGSVEGLIASETGNNAAVAGAVIPVLSLGIPGSAPAAVLLAAMF